MKTGFDGLVQARTTLQMPYNGSVTRKIYDDNGHTVGINLIEKKTVIAKTTQSVIDRIQRVEIPAESNTAVMKYQYKELADEEIVRAVGPNPEVDNSDEEKEVETVYSYQIV
ncbi:9567_t:CDS:2 [Entrophospora sp. SA101]|nr:10919_t:CDS:2 [Entrophospora sp. SA101]CAJ0855843.1 9567_t:CDS:2 [Entrophospora sp. SA101]